MMQRIPLTAAPAQTLSIILGGQRCQIALQQRASILYLDLSNDDSPIVRNKACRNLSRVLLASQYFNFIGDLIFFDTQGDTDPQFAGLEGRYQLLYLEPDDIAALGV